MSRKLACATLIVVGASVGLPAQSALVEDCGPTICYKYDDAQPAAATGGALDVFGLPSLVGDALVFAPFEFKAQSSNGSGSDIAQSNFVFDEIYSINPSVEILNINVDESGDYRIINGDAVDAVLRLQVTNLNTPIETVVNETTFATSGDSGGQQEWQLNNSVDPAASFKASANKVKVSMQNTLTAYTDPNETEDTAWIQKKLTITVTTVPIPAAVWLFGSALGLLGWMRSRKTV